MWTRVEGSRPILKNVMGRCVPKQQVINNKKDLHTRGFEN